MGVPALCIFVHMGAFERDYRLRVSDIGYGVSLYHWNDKRIFSPFWRFYWNSSEGASMAVAGETIPMVPSKVYLIPPLTWLDKSSATAVPHFNIHFNAGPTLDTLSGRHFSFSCDAPLRAAIEELIRLLETGHWGEIEIDVRATAIVASTLARLDRSAYAGQRTDARINAVCRYVREHLAERLTVAGLALHCGMSRRGFHQFFLRHTGLSPWSYVMKMRVDTAAELLHTTTRTIKQIAEDTGFCDRNHFTRVFAHYKGSGPASYRR